MYDLMFGGYGARAGHDGAEALSPVVNCANIPIEVHETINPVLVRRFELIADSGGAGRWRGGCGIRKDVELSAETRGHDACWASGTRIPVRARGGKPGSLAVNHGGARRRDSVAMGSKDVRALRRGDVVSFRLNGAAGWGDARGADPRRGRKTGRRLRVGGGGPAASMAGAAPRSPCAPSQYVGARAASHFRAWCTPNLAAV